MKRTRNSTKKKTSTNQKRGWSSILVSFGLSFVFIGLSYLLVANSVKSVITAYRRIKLLEQAQDEVSDLRYRNLELLRQREEIMDVDYVEKEARDRLFYVKDGEIMVVIPESDEFNEISDIPDSKNGDNADADEIWTNWWNLLKNGV